MQFDPTQNASRGLFGTFNGVFRPTILTILGIMLYLREGWLVGNAGLLGAIVVILSCYIITGTTALSISSITTNMRMGAGGVFSIISQSLGLEVGGSVGIPLYLAQGLSAALYMQGIVEAWLYLFPTHPTVAVTAAVFIGSVLTSFLGARFAFRVQILVMIGTILALISMIGGLKVGEINPTPVLWGNFEDGNLQQLFAVFFPAATGIMVGASMSGSLKTPRRSIPFGTLSAWGLSLIVYIGIAVWYAVLGTPESLRDTSSIFAVEHALWGKLVLIGMVSSCFSATLSSLVASPRVLQALASYRVVPFQDFLAKEHNGEPRHATLVTSGLVLMGLLLGDLNAIAQLLTMFFLVIYFMINLVLFIEHRLQMISFRPTFAIPHWIPLLGALLCLVAILIISPLMGMMAITFTLGIYVFLDRQQLQTPWETVHSGIFSSIAHWAAQKVMQENTNIPKRSWKPDLLVPVERVTQLEGLYRILKALVLPRGSIQVAGFDKASHNAIQPLIREFQQDDIFATSSSIEDEDFLSGMRTCVSVKAGSFFRPNTLFLSIRGRTEQELQHLLNLAQHNRMGAVFLGYHKESGFGRERCINLWVRDQSPNWQIGLKLANLDYAFLMAYQLMRNWGAKIRIVCVVSEAENVDDAQAFIEKLLTYARMSGHVEIKVVHGAFFDYLDEAPRADINIFGLSHTISRASMNDLIAKSESSCLFVLDSGNESALA